MANNDTDGTEYLKALRRPSSAQDGTAAAPAPLATGESAAGDSQPFAGPERRRSTRYHCEGSVEMREELHDVRTWATFKDISLHGCYVEATATYPVGTALELKLEANGFQVRARGIVRVTYPFLGMGIALTEMGQDDRARLKELLSTISRPAVVMGASLHQSETIEQVPFISDANAALKALVEFFGKRQMLLREEFVQILRKSQELATKSAP